MNCLWLPNTTETVRQIKVCAIDGKQFTQMNCFRWAKTTETVRASPTAFVYWIAIKTCYSKRREKVYKANMFFAFAAFVYWIAIFVQNTQWHVGTVCHTHYTLAYIHEYIYYHNSPPYTSHTHTTHMGTRTRTHSTKKIHAIKNVYNTAHMRHAKKNTHNTHTQHTQAHVIHGPPVIETKIWLGPL